MFKIKLKNIDKCNRWEPNNKINNIKINHKIFNINQINNSYNKIKVIKIIIYNNNSKNNNSNNWVSEINKMNIETECE
jgi:hypothetical protein